MNFNITVVNYLQDSSFWNKEVHLTKLNSSSNTNPSSLK